MEGISKIIHYLNQPGPTSGTDLAQELNVSRMAVQKRMQSLINDGLPVKAVRGVGYVLDSNVTLLEQSKIESGLISSVTDSIESMVVFQSIESTNSYLLSQPFKPNRARVCMAESQTSGRGRRGNNWQSTPYKNIMLSVSWSFDHWPATITGLGLAVGLVIAEYLNNQLGVNAKIKWPNDILVDNHKLGGILVDVSGESSGCCNVVIGLGLNVNQENWSSEVAYQWVDLASLGVVNERNELAADLISVLVAMLSRYEEAGFTPMTDRWNALNGYADQIVRVGKGSSAFTGRMQGVDENGALLIDVGGKIKRVDDSSLSVRLVVD